MTDCVALVVLATILGLAVFTISKACIQCRKLSHTRVYCHGYRALYADVSPVSGFFCT